MRTWANGLPQPRIGVDTRAGLSPARLDRTARSWRYCARGGPPALGGGPSWTGGGGRAGCGRGGEATRGGACVWAAGRRAGGGAVVPAGGAAAAGGWAAAGGALVMMLTGGIDAADGNVSPAEGTAAAGPAAVAGGDPRPRAGHVGALRATRPSKVRSFMLARTRAGSRSKANASHLLAEQPSR